MADNKTEDPTPKRRKEAREKGQIARSPDLTAWSGLLFVTFLMQSAAARAVETMTWLTGEMRDKIITPDPATAIGLLGDAMWRFALVALPLMGALLVVGVLGGLMQVGLKPSAKPLKPKWERVNPFKGIKRMVSPMSAWEGAKSTLKVAVIAGAAYPPLRATADAMAGADRPPVETVAVIVGTGMLTIIRNAAVAGLVIAIADYLLQRRKTLKSMKMTKQEVRDEHKQQEGDPMLKGAIRERQMRMSRNRMMADVANADAVIVNPTHIAVALKYDAAKGAPRVVAKGSGEVATRIREQAEEHGVPIVRDVPLARTLHKVCEIGHEVPLEMYEAVARLLAFVYALKARNLHRGTHELTAA